MKLFAEFAIPIAGTIALAVLTPVVRHVVRRLADALDLKESEHVERLVLEKVDEGIAYAEQRGLQWTKARGALPDGAQKLDWALKFIGRELDAVGVIDVTTQRLIDLIESRLGDARAPGDAVEGMETTQRLRMERLRASVPPAVTALLAFVLLGGCAGAAAGTHVELARGAGTLIDGAGDAIEAVCTVDALRVHENPLRFGERCEKTRDAQHVAVELWELWVELGQQEDVDLDAVLVVARRLASAYDEVRTFVADFGRELPALEVPR
ncbi:MAG: hypothetical protein AAGH15_27930 [Myxococcota bacterium]